ncbi:hypothetical protein AB0958_22250 [Streptomyces sp. NPDC006655]|uniref:hypothetical protein n=1 Tax=Streptomyces sp. NPDC006655 TaxID=3156898 RepID=UPI003454CEF2
MTDAKTGPGRRPTGGDVYPGEEQLPGREGKTTDWGDASVSGVTPGQEETAPSRAGGADDTEAPGQGVLVAGEGPGHENDTGRDSTGRDSTGTGTAAGRGAVMGGQSAPSGEPATGSGTAVGRESAASGGTAVDGASAVGSRTVAGRESGVGGGGGQLLPNEECGQLERRLHQAVAGFVDEPRAAVEEADRAVEELTARFTEAIDRRRRTLRGSWQSAGGDQPGTSDTEQLRLALRDYRELADRLLHI